MANLTPNYNLAKPLITEKYDVNLFNGNADKLDLELDKVSKRVDTIITTPAAGISAQEITDARQGEVSLGANLTKVAERATQLINVKYPPLGLIGAKGDGIVDDTIALNAIVQFAKTSKIGGIWFPDGTYMIKAQDDNDPFPAYAGRDGGIIIDCPLRITLHPAATLKAITGNKGGYAIVNIKNATNVYFDGGKIVGERYTHIGTEEESGFGIQIIGSENIYIKDVNISDCWGDGICTIYRANALPYKQSNNLHFDGVVSKNNRRQGMSLIDGRNIRINNCEFSGSNGALPESGLDIEPDNGCSMITDVLVSNCIFDGNAGYGMVFGHGQGCERVIVANNIFKNSKLIAINIVKTPDTVGKINKNISVINNLIEVENSVGFSVAGTKDVFFSGNELIDKGIQATTKGIDTNATDITISDNVITGFQYGALFVGDATPINVRFKNNIFKDLEIGIYANTQKSKCEIVGNAFSEISTVTSCIQALFTDSIISNNIFDGLQGRAINTNPIRCIIKDNLFKRVGLAAPTTQRIIELGGLAEGNIFQHNIFLGDALLAITADYAAPTPNYFYDNIAQYTASPYSIHTSNVVENNKTSNKLRTYFAWNPGTIVAGTGVTSADISVPGAAMGDYVSIAAPYDIGGTTFSGYVVSAGIVRARLQNGTAASIALGYNGYWRARVIKLV